MGYFQCPFIARTDACVSLSPLDYWSVGHLLMGIILYVFVYLYRMKKGLANNNQKKELIICEIIIILMAIGWEVLENTLVYYIGIKIKRDSWINLTTDIILWSLGGLGSLGLTKRLYVNNNINAAYTYFAILNLILWGVLFLILLLLTKFNI